MWNQERIETLTRMWRDGYSAPAIAAAIGHGITESSVLKKKDRLGLLRPEGKRAIRRVNSWKDENIERLCELWADRSLSASKIGQELGVSRSAVLGMAHRLDLTKRGLQRVAPAERKPRVRKPNGHNPTGYSGKVRTIFPEGPLPVTPVADHEIPQEQRRTLLQLTKHTCKWPVGDPQSPDFFFCGAKPLTGSSYCPHHQARSRTRASIRERVANGGKGWEPK